MVCLGSIRCHYRMVGLTRPSHTPYGMVCLGARRCDAPPFVVMTWFSFTVDCTFGRIRTTFFPYDSVNELGLSSPEHLCLSLYEFQESNICPLVLRERTGFGSPTKLRGRRVATSGGRGGRADVASRRPRAKNEANRQNHNQPQDHRTTGGSGIP